MNNSFTLDDLRNETIQRYAPVKVTLSDGTTVELVSILKLRQKDREEALKVIDDIKEIEDVEEDDDETVAELAEKVCEACAKIFRIIANSPRKLLAELEHEDPQIKANLHTAVLSRWVGGTQVGEADSSPTS